jgi:hypothetical protein
MMYHSTCHYNYDLTTLRRLILVMDDFIFHFIFFNELCVYIYSCIILHVTITMNLTNSMTRKFRQESADKEKELARLATCLLDCGVMCKVELMTHHIQLECPNRNIQCE